MITGQNCKKLEVLKTQLLQNTDDIKYIKNNINHIFQYI